MARVVSSEFGMGSALKWGLILGGGYFLYRNYFAAGAAGAAAPITLDTLRAAVNGGPQPVSTTAPAAVAPTSSDWQAAALPQEAPITFETPEAARAQLVDDMNRLALGKYVYLLVGDTMDAWHWNAIRNEVRAPVHNADLFWKAFPQPDVLITAEQYVDAMHSVGLAGLGLTLEIPVPVVWRTAQGRPTEMFWPANRTRISGARPVRLVQEARGAVPAFVGNPGWAVPSWAFAGSGGRYGLR